MNNLRSGEIFSLDLEANLKDYDKTADSFDWKNVEKEFSWFKTGKVNIVYEAVDRHVAAGCGDQIALYFFDETREETYTYRQLMELSCQFANGLKNLGITKGDRVFLYMPRSPELFIALLGSVRIGAIVGPLFEAFMEEAVKDRLQDSQAVALVTSPQLRERIADQELPNLKHIILTGEATDIKQEKEIRFDDVMNISDEYTIEWVDREDSLFLFYTSGSTGKPKGVVHVHNIMIHQYAAGKWAFDFREGDIYWCTADPGWITGTSAGIFAPLLHGIRIVSRGGRFKPENWYETLEKYHVTVWFSAPTAFRMLMAQGSELPKKFNLSSIRHILSAGEPLNPEVIYWGMQVLKSRIHDNWWMTETGCTICSNYRSMPIRPGSMGKPLPGIEMAIVDDQGKVLPPMQMGNLAIKPGWPGMMRRIWGNPERYQLYFLNGWYISGDSAYQDQEGYFWFEGRVDDVINTAGERVGPFEVESKLVEHPAVADAGVIGIPDPVRGEVIKAFITLRVGYQPSDELTQEISQFVRSKLAAHAAPRTIEYRDKLPKTRSGKIMRRVLKALELGLPTGDLSTLED